ncbi:unnamed protein product [marine sediment metagenome]|uniref:PD-(D/E)XK endonuclease-like domain-containing protein n=1 Tax=marine sediment metagenome TaxID=412755 RepID=X0XLV1_9ZZZZ
MVDLKTCAATLNTFERAMQVRFDRQPLIYRHLARAGLRELGLPDNVVGVIHIVIQKPNLKFCEKDKGDFERYIGRCRRDFFDARQAAYQERTRDCPPILVSTIEYSSASDPAWFLASLREYERAARAVPDSGQYYPDEAACFKWKRRCPMWDLCASNPVLWPQVVAEKYEQSFRDDEEINR